MALLDFSSLNSLGPIIPFIFMLAIVYGALEVSGVFKNRAVNALIAVTVAVMAIMSPVVVSFIYAIIPYAAILFVIFFFVAIVTKPFRNRSGGSPPPYEFLIIIIILILIFLVTMSGESSPLYGLFNIGILSSENFMWIIGLVGIILIFYYVYKMSSERPAGQ